tara:strand:+ start:467 stop:826 length:360 start_codon:yes stop_codon:yes gene_type:complete
MKQTKNTTWKQKLNSSETLRNDIKHIFKYARKEKRNHGQILESIKLMIYTNQKYTTLPNYMQSSINGYIRANFEFMSEFVEWVHWYDGKFVGKNVVYNSEFEQDKLISDYVYIGTEDKY